MRDTIQLARQRLMAWWVHAFTASGAFVGLLALLAIHQNKLLVAFWLMGLAIVIDAVDGCFARLLRVREIIPQIDGALLDNIIDFFTYALVPAFFILVVPMVPEILKFPCAFVITLASAYQFTQVNAKTHDHFFLGFPSYWNIAIFYLFFWQMNPWLNAAILFLLAGLSFVPVKYVYPSRLDYLTQSAFLRIAMLVLTILWGVATTGLLWTWPNAHPLLVFLSVGYLLLYVGISLYRTWVPLSVID
ncbi:MAG: phosphatidylcholine synthase [Gammaproteobacteria bacterium]|nr:phosphatidylcholine synthase [Gammaproteobacteria bacterium]